MRKIKQIGVKFHYVQDAVDSESVQIANTPSIDNLSHSLTNVLVGDDYNMPRVWLGVTALPAIERGCQEISPDTKSDAKTEEWLTWLY